jgi:hypothetical protein
MGIMKRVRNTGMNGTTSPSSPQLSKNTAGDLSNPAQTGRGNARPDKIFLLFPLPVKVTRRRDNQEWQGGMATRGDKKHLRRFFGKHDSTMAPECRWPDPEPSPPSSCT